MKIVAFIGSLRKDSYNRKLFRSYVSVSKDLFFLEEADYTKLPLYNQELDSKTEPLPELARLASLVKSADGILFVTPEYNYSVPGVLKNGIDWLSRVTPQPFAQKPCAIIGASMGMLGSARAQYHLRQTCVFLDLFLMNKPEVMVGQAQTKFDEAGSLTDAMTLKILGDHAQAFGQFVGRFSR